MHIYHSKFLSQLGIAASIYEEESIAILLVTGIMFSSTLVLILTVLMQNQNAQPEFRSRIMGLRTLAIYAHAFGSLAAGAVAGGIGAPMTAGISEILGISMVVALAFLVPEFRRFQNWASALDLCPAWHEFRSVSDLGRGAPGVGLDGLQ